MLYYKSDNNFKINIRARKKSSIIWASKRKKEYFPFNDTRSRLFPFEFSCLIGLIVLPVLPKLPKLAKLVVALISKIKPIGQPIMTKFGKIPDEHCEASILC